MNRRRAVLNHQSAKPPNADRWLVSYADFITLLFAFFVLMYASSTLSETKYQHLVQALSHQFKTMPPAVLLEHTQREQTQKKVEPSAPEGAVSALGEALSRESFLKEPGYRFAYQSNFFELELNVETVFETGSVILIQAAKDRLARVLAHLREASCGLLVEGYTDDQPVASNPFYASNWALSAARAAAVVDYFVQHGMDKNRLTVIGYGERFPVIQHQNGDGQKKSRRVVLVGVSRVDVVRALQPEQSLLKDARP